MILSWKYFNWHKQKIKLAGAQPMAHPTAEPVEILITRPSQKIKSREPTHQNLPHRGYFKNILGLKPLDFILEHPKGFIMCVYI